METVHEATIQSLHAALLGKQTTCVSIVLMHLARIEALDKHINSVISLNPRILEEAADLDAEISSSPDLGSVFSQRNLFGVPVLLKDNFDVARLPTTAGCRALWDNIAIEDAACVKVLRQAGALILGKTNMHEFALEGLTVSSVGGQTLNPYDCRRTPGGSSGGSAAALAASFAVLAMGTDTMNSLRNPASACAICSCRPTQGLISREGIMPVSRTQDVVGPMARTTRDVAIALTVMARATTQKARQEQEEPLNYVAELDAANIKDLTGVRLGFIEAFVGKTEDEEHVEVRRAVEEAASVFQDEGATVVRIQRGGKEGMREMFDSDHLRRTLDTQRYEFGEEIEKYLAGQIVTPLKSLAGIFEQADYLVIPSQYEFIRNALISSTADTQYGVVRARIETLKLELKGVFDTYKLDALIYPQQKQPVVEIGSPSQTGRNGMLAALTGSPVVTVPMAPTQPTEDAPLGVPQGLEILGRPWTESKLLQIANHFEVTRRYRKAPLFSSSAMILEAAAAAAAATGPSAADAGVRAAGIEEGREGRILSFKITSECVDQLHRSMHVVEKRAKTLEIPKAYPLGTLV